MKAIELRLGTGGEMLYTLVMDWMSSRGAAMVVLSQQSEGEA